MKPNRRLHEMLSSHVERGEVPGLVVLVSRGDDVEAEAIGAKTAGAADPVRPDTIFRITSMTKPITAAAAMILVDEGVLRLDDSVEALLPELAERRVLRTIDAALDDTVPAGRSITVRDRAERLLEPPRLGLRRRRGDGARVAGQPRGYGWDGGFGTSWSSDPDGSVVAILLTQRAAFPSMTGLYRDVWDVVYGQL